MAEPFGVTASALAVAELSAKVISQCLQYSRAVKHAKDDVERVTEQVTNWKTVAKKLQDLLDGPHRTRLQTSQEVRGALKDGRRQLGSLHDKLTSSKTRQKMTRFGFRALKWPFDSKEVEKILQDLSESMQLVAMALQLDQTVAIFAIDNNLVSVDQKAALSRLPEAAGAAFDSHAEEHNSTCLPDTRVDLLHEIDKWVEDPDAKAVFWLNGMAGTGKSTISRTLAHSFSNRNQLGASFFFKRGEGDRGGVSKFFTTIAAQLIRWELALAVHVKDAIDADPAICNKAMREQFEKLVLNPLTRITSRDRKSHALVIVVDALDECDRDEDVKLIIHLLSRANASKSLRIRIFLTSRPELPIRLGFHNVKGTYQDLILHEVEQPIIEHDLSVYFKHELAKVRREYNTLIPPQQQLPSTWPEETQVQTLVKMAIPLFIFAATACRFLADRRTGTPNTKLQRILEHQTRSQESKLDATYLPVLNQLLIGLSNSEETKVLGLFKHLIGSVILLANPLSTPALAYLLGISEDVINNHLNYLHSVLSIPLLPDSPVRLFHLSFRDFLIDPSKRGKNLFWVDEKETHKHLAADCLRVMNKTLCVDICQVKWPGTLRASINPQIISDKLRPEVQYACQYWVYHIQQAGDVFIDNGQVLGFLQQHFLHWLEALSLIGRASESLQNIGILQSLLQSEGNSQVLHFINDALRFARTNVSAIQAAPLQTYCSALVFAPEKSIIRNTFQSNIPDWISLKAQVNPDWSSCLQTLEGHTDRVTSVAPSPDGQTLASASYDKTVRIWSTNTGVCLQTLEGHTAEVCSVAFSPNGQTLASASSDYTVRIWSTNTGACLQTLQEQTKVCSVAFSPNSQTLALALSDNTIQIWSTNTGVLQTLEGHTGPVCSVIFSPNGQTLASASGDYTVRIWST
ncbi:hypothetical protein EV127DRAFT_386433, partial [Xylaria flabelliformis]